MESLGLSPPSSSVAEAGGEVLVKCGGSRPLGLCALPTGLLRRASPEAAWELAWHPSFQPRVCGYETGGEDLQFTGPSWKGFLGEASSVESRTLWGETPCTRAEQNGPEGTENGPALRETSSCPGIPWGLF